MCFWYSQRVLSDWYIDTDYKALFKSEKRIT